MDDLQFVEEPVRFPCEGDTLIGVLSRPVESVVRLAVVIVVGGPQYRIGSHRQFVLLARTLASEGWPALRFDVRGMGDSTGAARSFETINADMRAAIDEVYRRLPDIEGVVLWGLCDAASAAMMYAPTDGRVAGLALANPWARAAQTYAKAQLRHYYVRRAVSVDLWRKLLSGRFGFRRSMHDFAQSVGQIMRQQPDTRDYRHRMLDALRRFKGPVLWILSGRDLTCREFLAFVERERALPLLDGERAHRTELPASDHTFAHPDWRADVEAATVEWLRLWWHRPSQGSRAAV